MTRTDPIIAVKDVEASLKWFRSVFNCRSLHSGKEFDVLHSEDDEIHLTERMSGRQLPKASQVLMMTC